MKNIQKDSSGLPAFSEPEVMFLYLALQEIPEATADTAEKLVEIVEQNFRQMQDSQIFPAFDMQSLLQHLADFTPAYCHLLMFKIAQMSESSEANILQAAQQAGLL